MWYHSELYLPIPAPGMILKRSARREGEAMISNFVAFVESVTGLEGLGEADGLPYAEETGYEQPGYAQRMDYGRGFEPGFGTA